MGMGCFLDGNPLLGEPVHLNALSVSCDHPEGHRGLLVCEIKRV
jgi:hypothetical protein